MQPELLDALASEVALTIKQAMAPVQADVQSLRDQVATWEARWNDVGALRERVAVVEARPQESGIDIAPVQARISELDARISLTAGETALALTKEFGTLRERVAVLETRAPVPGPAGQAGTHGKDGADGLGFDDVSVEHDGERSFTFKYTRGERVKTAGTFTVPLMIYRGVFAEGKTYEVGDVVSWAGSTWHCEKTTVLKPDSVGRDPVTGEAMGRQGKDFWTLIVKAGREGKQGRDGRDLLPLPVVAVGGRK